MKIIDEYERFYVVQCTADELARCLAFDNDRQRLASPGQTPFRKGEIVLVEPHPQPPVSNGRTRHENPGATSREL
jgi:hypothetical protein